MKVYTEMKRSGEYARGGNVYNKSWQQDHKRYNKSESYEIPMSKRKRKYANGGVVGQEIVIDNQGEEVEGVIVDIHNSGDYIVRLEDGRSVLAQRDRDIISFGDMAKAPIVEAPRKRFGFFKDGGRATGVEWMKSDGQYEAELGDLYLIIEPSTQRGLYQVRVKKGYRGETIGKSQNEISGLNKAKDLAYEIASDYYNQISYSGGEEKKLKGHIDFRDGVLKTNITNIEKLKSICSKMKIECDNDSTFPIELGMIPVLSTSKEGGEDEERFNSGTTVVEIPKGVPIVPIVPLNPLKPCRDGEATPNPVNEGENDAVVECKG
jgi:hypothetical protein